MRPEDTIGIVGLGSLGMSIAGSLFAAGRPVVGYRRSDADEFRRQGGRLVSSPREVLETSAVIFTALTDDAALLAVVDGADGFLSGNAQGRIVIDLSTTTLPPRFAVRERLLQAGAAMIDCPVSGLPSMVRQRKGVFLASADADEFAAAEPYLRLVSDEVYYVGAFGNGTKLKYLANFLMVVHAAAAAETVAVARAAGLDPALVVEVLSRSAGASFQLASRGPGMAARDYPSPQASIDQLTKDLGAIGEFQRSLGLDSGLLRAAVALVDRTRSLGFGGLDPTALVEAAQTNLAAAPQDNQLDTERTTG